MTRFSTYTVASLLGGLLILVGGTELRAQASGETPGGEAKSPTDSTLALSGDSLRKSESWRAGIYLGLNRNIYTADDLKGLPGIPNCCPGFSEGGGLGLAVGAMAEMPINDWFAVGGRLYINTYNGALVHEETVVVDDEGFATEAIFQHRIDTDIWATSIEPVLVFGVGDEAKLFTGLRGDVVVRKLFKQEERILEPETIVFENGRNVRMEYEGTIPNGTSFQGSVVLGLRYDIYVDDQRQWVISPEVSGWYSLSPVVADESWKNHGIRIAFIGQYLRYEQEEKMPEGISGPLEIEEDLSFEGVDRAGTDRTVSE